MRCNANLREMNVDVVASDEFTVEVVASGLPLYHGAQLAVDITLRSALSAKSVWPKSVLAKVGHTTKKH